MTIFIPPIDEDGPRTVRMASQGHDLARIYAAAYPQDRFGSLTCEAMARSACLAFLKMLDEEMPKGEEG